MSDFYGIKPGTIPGFAEAGAGSFMSVTDLPGHTVRNMAMFMDKLRGMHEDDPLAFEVCVRHVASMIEDQRREEGRTDPRGTPPDEVQFPRGRSAAPARPFASGSNAHRWLRSAGISPLCGSCHPVKPKARSQPLTCKVRDGLSLHTESAARFGQTSIPKPA